jgi:hypothetical protein
MCDLDAKPRKIGEALLREGVGVREVADFLTWWLNKELPAGEKPKVLSKSSVDRHKNGGHFALKPADEAIDLTNVEFTDVEGIAREMLRRYGAKLKDPTYIPSAKEAQDWAALEAKVADLEQRRRDQNELMALMAGATFRKPAALTAGVTVIDVTPTTSKEGTT